jgi:hypothetical protein
MHLKKNMQKHFKFSLKKNAQITLGFFFCHMQEKKIFFNIFLGFVWQKPIFNKCLSNTPLNQNTF